MSGLTVDDTLMTSLPLLLGSLLIGTVLVGTLLRPATKARIVRWLFVPLYFCASAGMLALLLFAPGAEQSVTNFLIAGGGMALAIWSYLRGRKATSKIRPEMGTSE